VAWPDTTIISLFAPKNTQFRGFQTFKEDVIYLKQ